MYSELFLYFFPKLGRRQILRLSDQDVLWNAFYKTNMWKVMQHKLTRSKTQKNTKKENTKNESNTSWNLIGANENEIYFAYLILWEYELL